jgi:hypothetical protein
MVLGSFATEEEAAAMVRGGLTPARERVMRPSTPASKPPSDGSQDGARTAPTPKQEANFRRRVQLPEGRLGQWGCWTWNGQTSKASILTYGRFDDVTEGKKRHLRAHRMMWHLTYGPIPDGLMVLHKCDNPLCVKPAHLYLGTAADNTWDMLSRGRAGGTLPPHGKLTEEDVAEIRRIWVTREVQGRQRTHPTMKELGARYGVSDAMIHHVVHERWWKAIPAKAVEPAKAA